MIDQQEVLRTHAFIILLLRGLPGAGKSTLGEALGLPCVAADDFRPEGPYDPADSPAAHAACLAAAERFCEQGRSFAVANTFVREWEMEPYYQLAARHSYRVYSVIVENRHGGAPNPPVPWHVVQSMRKRFAIQLGKKQ